MKNIIFYQISLISKNQHYQLSEMRGTDAMRAVASYLLFDDNPTMHRNRNFYAEHYKKLDLFVPDNASFFFNILRKISRIFSSSTSNVKSRKDSSTLSKIESVMRITTSLQKMQRTRRSFQRIFGNRTTSITRRLIHFCLQRNANSSGSLFSHRPSNSY